MKHAEPWPHGANVMDLDGPERIVVVAHRGDSGNHPENTRAAFEAAVALRVECIELDVHLSRDGELVIIHDDRVDRTSDGSGEVSDLTWSQIKTLDAGLWFGAAFAGERFLTLDEALELIPEPIRLNVHIKTSAETLESVTRSTVSILHKRGLLERAYVAGDETTLSMARSECEHIEICNLSVLPAEDYVARSASIGCRILQPGHAMTDTALVEAAHARHMLVFPFFADEPDEMQRLIDCGVDGILTNEPQRLKALLDNETLRR
ncbi:MAG: hypothetical protein HOM68_16430 [Gemmatimonadetes bacterium]|jgi:glycerophosphoryl diester phosphodiesterase|nr:hypothetical protein [Gemmatimonadota bacterium]MBT4612979.1 hypothetical protein [Gemmatimonadota bacterium]MBT5058129.1 hypothetical protein [Gemmatimonadota bacterium]MBT5142465.1 hypothetical protein [Gemmatimonadota bacterium]MBT5586395.1 hypothetical protein [Gemmatimonadota bacterium]